MKFGIANNVRSEVRECTPGLLNQALDSALVARVCAEIEDALEKSRCGELTKDEYETIKATLKKKLPIFTFHALFKNCKRKNEEAIASGLSIYDLDHIANPEGRWAEIEAIEQQEYGSEQTVRKGPQNLLELLPDTFTREEAGKLRQRMNIRRGSLKLMLSNWKHRGYIELQSDGEEDIGMQVFRKTEAYLQRFA